MGKQGELNVQADRLENKKLKTGRGAGVIGETAWMELTKGVVCVLERS